MERLWLAADYHFPGTYSLRIPLSSVNNTRVMPAPGPGTVRLALIRTGVELFGLRATREDLFPSLCAIQIRVRPPAQIAMTPQRLHGYKWSRKQHTPHLSLITRDMAQTSAIMTIYLHIPAHEEQMYRMLLHTVGYWGQSDSLTTCVAISERSPLPGECMMPLAALPPTSSVQPFFLCLASEFRHAHLSWEEVVVATPAKQEPFVRLDLSLWPLLIQRRGECTLLTWCPLPT
ncbi:MAG: hypothetical protein ABI456_17895 [Ktedonobacteraceae bacterium]